MSTTGTNIGLVRAWGSGFDGWDGDMDANLLALDTLVQGIVKSVTTTAQPGSPAAGDCYVVPVSATGSAWSGKDKDLAVYNGSAWVFYTPKRGWMVYNQADDKVYLYKIAWVMAIDLSAV
ncbi:MAG TPA: DUF2793 domain-containing protein [Gemmatimonadaceae bacterium]|jgi:hypothetical protein|nr:DUF2793 domain-containing protein [Gemmatimonadaceae bacterium]